MPCSAQDYGTIRVLLVEDNPGDARLVQEFLREAPEVQYEVQHHATLGSALQHLQESGADVVLLDLGLPDSQGLGTLKRFQEQSEHPPLVVLTNESNLDVGVRAVAEGAQDYLLKDRIDPWLLTRTLRYAIERRRHQQQVTKADIELRAAEIRVEEVEKAKQRLEQEVAERKRAEEQVQSLNLKLQQRVDRLAALHSIDRVINASTNLGLTLQVLARQIRQQLNVDAVAVLLYSEASMELEFAAGDGFTATQVEERRVRLGDGPVGRALLERRSLSVPNLAAADVFQADGLLAGEDFYCYHGGPLVAKGNLRGLLEAYHREPMDFSREWLGWFGALAEQTAIAVENSVLFRNVQRSHEELALAYDRTIEGWARALGFKDEETARHSQHVTKMTVALARHLGLTEKSLVHVRRGALLHDIGKMMVPDRILLKPGKLDEAEWEVMKQHTTRAYELLMPIEFLRPALDIPHAHHERWDGGGYPRGLAGEEIPLAARIFAVVDVWEALSSDRPYRKAWPEEDVLTHLRKESGKHFDPVVVEAFLELLTEDGGAPRRSSQL